MTTPALKEKIGDGISGILTPDKITNYKLKGVNVRVEAVRDAEPSQKLVSDIIETFESYLQDLQMNQEDLDGHYTLVVCEKVEKTDNANDCIAVDIEREGPDGGYLHVYGWREL